MRKKTRLCGLGQTAEGRFNWALKAVGRIRWTGQGVSCGSEGGSELHFILLICSAFMDTSSGSLPIPFSFHSSSFYLPLLFLPPFLLSSTIHPTSHPSIHPASQPVSLPPFCPFILPSLQTSKYVSIYLFIHPSILLPFLPSIHPPAFLLSLHPSSHLSISLIFIV